MRTKSSMGTLIGVMVVCASLSLMLPAGAQSASDAVTARLQILNGKTGRPVVNQKIVLMGGDGITAHKARPLGSETTDGEGYAPIPNLDASVGYISVFVGTFHPCSKVDKRTFSLEAVHAGGVVSENSWSSAHHDVSAAGHADLLCPGSNFTGKNAALAFGL